MTVGKDMTPAVINEVQKDSPAMVGGLKQGDIILMEAMGGGFTWGAVLARW